MKSKFIQLYNKIILEETTTTYTVKKGDVLSKIAKKFKVSTKQIVTKNNLKNPNSLKIGQKLIIPINFVTTPRKKKTIDLKQNQQIYTVKTGDTLDKISDLFSITTDKIIARNKLEKLIIGKKLIIPADNNLYTYVKIKSGDTFTSIAEANKYATFLQIKKVNKNLDQTKLQIGQLVKIPKKPKAKGKLYPESQNDRAKEIAYGFIKTQEGKVIQNNFHVVYDDKNNKNYFDENIETLDNFLKSCKGVPTIGYGTTNLKFIKAKNGKITQKQAEQQLNNYINEVCKYMPNRFGQSWNCLNRNQRAAIISFFYQQGKDQTDNPYVAKLIKAVQDNNIVEACKNINSTNPNLENRRKAEQQLFNKKLDMKVNDGK